MVLCPIMSSCRAYQGNINLPCSADHEQDWQPYAVDPYSAICDDHTYLPKGTKLELGREALLVNTIILNQPYRHCISTDRLNREDSQLAASLEGEPGPTPARKTFPHSYPEIRFRRERARDTAVWEGLSGGCRAGLTLDRCSQQGVFTIQPVG